jgi:hypothetical protein
MAFSAAARLTLKGRLSLLSIGHFSRPTRQKNVSSRPVRSRRRLNRGKSRLSTIYGSLRGFGGVLAIQDPINIQKDHFHPILEILPVGTLKQVLIVPTILRERGYRLAKNNSRRREWC